MSKSFYLTTPIYYVNDTPHIGHAYTTVLADVLARFHKLAGEDVFFLTGTDEHGQKVQQAADKSGMTPQAHCDLYSRRFKDAWKEMNIGFDKFIRTTDPEHVSYVRGIFRQLWDRKQIYEKEYEGWYSVGEERFFTEKELVDGKDPIGGKPVELIREKNYFFKMSAYQEWLIKYIEDHPDFILPDFRRNEVLGFLRQPLNDLCISRPKSRLAWGISLPFDEDYVAYVWVDALFNYSSAVEKLGRWPADYHLLGKDILTTHAVYWPTMLKALDMPLPKHLLAHGWWMYGDAKMSKSSGNVVNPLQMKDVYGVDPFRYFLMREMVVGQDSSFTETALVGRINSDLANDVGNGLSRILKLAATGLGSRLVAAESAAEEDRSLRRLAEETIPLVLDKVKALKLSFAIEDVLQLIRGVNRYLETTAPWKLAKLGDEGKARLNAVLYHAAEALRVGFLLLHPVMPGKMDEALAALGLKADYSSGLGALRWGAWAGGALGEPGVALFPRIQPSGDGEAAAPRVTASGVGVATPADPFSLVQLKVAQVEEVEDHPNADGLYVLRLRVGDEARTICAGLRKHLSKEELKGRLIVMVYNLKPAALRGVESAGMLLAAEDANGKLSPVRPENAKSGDAVTAEGLASAPKPVLTLKEFEKAPLKTAGGLVVYGDRPLRTQGGPVRADAPDGRAVK